MSQMYYFGDQAGSIPGVPGVFAHCIVEVNEQGEVTILPFSLAQHPLVIDATLAPAIGYGEITAEETTPQEQPPALEPIEQASTTQEEEVSQEVVPEPNNVE